MAKKSKPESDGSPEAPGPAYFTSLSLENVRRFREKQTLKLDDGENGTGKTTVLQALARFDAPYGSLKAIPFNEAKPRGARRTGEWANANPQATCGRSDEGRATLR